MKIRIKVTGTIYTGGHWFDNAREAQEELTPYEALKLLLRHGDNLELKVYNIMKKEVS